MSLNIDSDDETTQFYTEEKAIQYLRNRGYKIEKRKCLNDWTIDGEDVVCYREMFHEGACVGTREECGTGFRWLYKR